MESTQHPLLLNLQQELEAHPVNSNVFFEKFSQQALSLDHLKSFLKQYHYFCKQFVKLLEGLLYRTPIDLVEMRIELTKTLYSELGNGDPQNAHIRLLTNFATALGMTEKELQATNPIPSVTTYLETLHRLFMESDYLRALGAELAVEVTAGAEFRYFYPALATYGVFRTQDLEFFRLHLEEEAHHGSWLMNAVEHTAVTYEDYERVTLGARTAADAWHAFWLGMDRATFLLTPQAEPAWRTDSPSPSTPQTQS